MAKFVNCCVKCFKRQYVSGNIMKLYLTILLLLITLPTLGQSINCFCSEDSTMNEGMVSCDTITLSNNAKLYWQYNCDSIWLTLENVNGLKYVIDEIPLELYEYAERLGSYLIKEFEKTILFERGCAAMGPCLYTLIDKNNGSQIKEFDQLICIYEEDYQFDFVVYLSDTSDDLVIYFINSNKQLQVPFKEELTEIDPEYQFKEMTMENNILTLYYISNKNRKKTLRIDLNDNKYSR